jgi:hypothetical protein
MRATVNTQQACIEMTPKAQSIPFSLKPYLLKLKKAIGKKI